MFKPDDWKEDYDKENIIFYKYTGKISEYTTPDAFCNAKSASTNYEKAKKERDEEVV